MELICLNFEYLKSNDNQVQSGFHGKVLYDPLDLTLSFYDSEQKLLYFEIHISNVNILKPYLKDNKIAFNYEDGVVIIFYEKDDILELKVWKSLLYKITKIMNEAISKRQPVDQKYIVSKAKDYQEEIFEFAKKNNTIVFLETGLGKTYIAIMLIKEIYGEDRLSNYNNPIPYEKKTTKKVIFLFKTISLLLQQSKVLKCNTNLKIFKLYGGVDSINIPSFQRFREVIKRYDIICATPESIYRYFTFGYLNINDVELIIMDECHHAKDKDYYNMILKHFVFNNDDEVINNIKILGLTASPSFDNDKTEEKIMLNIQNLCNNMNSFLVCPSNILKEYEENKTNTKKINYIQLEGNNDEYGVKVDIFTQLVMPFINPYIDNLRLDGKISFTPAYLEPLYFINIFLSFICEEEKFSEKQNGIYEKSDYELVDKHKDIFMYVNNFDMIMERFAIELERSSMNNEKMNFSKEIKDIDKKFKEDSIVKEINKYIKNCNYITKYADTESICNYTLQTLKTLQQIYFSKCYTSNEDLNQGFKYIDNLRANKVYKSIYLEKLEKFFLDIINKKDSSKSNTKSIVFVNQRIVAKFLHEKINKYINSFGYCSTYVIGCQSNKPTSAIYFNEEELKHNISLFSDDSKCIVLFATNVVEEGIDVPQCNNVVNINDIKSIKEYIQKSGRARKSDSIIHLFCLKKELNFYKSKIEQIKTGINVMKKIINEKQLVPTLKKEILVKDANYYETSAGARVYLLYAKRIIQEFVGKLFNDGYSFLRTQNKIEKLQRDSKIVFRPYLCLPNVLECNFRKIYDNEDVYFEKEAEAKDYISKNEDYYYLKAVKLLCLNNYLNDYFLFSKNFDDLLHIENTSSKYLAESKLVLKIENNDYSKMEEITFIAQKLIVQPNYIDINYNNESDKKQIIAIVSHNELTSINFDLFIHSTQLMKLYYFNTTFPADENSEKLFSERKPKIPFNIFSKINVSMDDNEIRTLTVKKDNISFISFFYTYILFFSTDAEIFFYYNIYNKKFDFADLFWNDKKTSKYLEGIFKDFEITKKHLVDYREAKLNYDNHIVKFTVLTEDANKNWNFDIEYITNTVKHVKEDIELYYFFLKTCVINSEEEKGKLLTDEDYKMKKSNDLVELHKNNKKTDFDCGDVCRNLINSSKTFLLPFSKVDLRGSSIHKKSQKSYQDYYIDKYNIITSSTRDYKKALPLDYNQKVLRHKVNLRSLGKVYKVQGKNYFLKKFNYIPSELMQKVRFASIDQIYMFTLLPVILYKVQNSLIYYYEAYCLRQKFESFNTLKYINMKLFTQALNAKSTMECNNYECLEFLGDSVLKFLSSYEVFCIYPIGNRDLLYSKRRTIENNKNLFIIASDDKNQLYKHLFTSPITMKRVTIPGFSNDDSLIFNIGFNRSFSKNCFSNQIPLQSDDEVTNKIISNEHMMEDENNKVSKEETLINEGEWDEKTPLNVNMDHNPEPIICNADSEIRTEGIDTIAKEKIEIIPSNRYRIIYNKVLADMIESLSGFLFYNNYKSKGFTNMFDRVSQFLGELGVLNKPFDLDEIEEFWLKDLANPKCRFSEREKYFFVKHLAENKIYTFNHIELLFQAVTHPTYLVEESFDKNFPYVNRSYQRLAFLGEAFVSFYVSFWVYSNNKEADECLLHKLKICGINHHVISLIAIDLKLDKSLLKNNNDIDSDMKHYMGIIEEIRKTNENRYKLPDETLLDDNFIIILCELFHAYIGAILLDSRNISTTYIILEKIMDVYLKNNATKENYTEHPKVTILDEFMKRRQYFNKIKENGSNRIHMKNDKSEKYRKMKIYKYQLIIDKYVIYEEFIYYNRSTIKVAQGKARDVFMKICKEIDRREKFKSNERYFDLEAILKYLSIPYEKTQI